MSARCRICPHNCYIDDNMFGICGVRSSSESGISLPYYGSISAVSTDPVEKKPLYHYHPSSSIFSIGFFGCNLSCPFCQNHRISKDFRFHANPDRTSPERIAAAAYESGSFGIAFTYSEPIIHFEYVIDTAKEARKLGLKNVLVTNGFINNDEGVELLDYMDAVNIDLKSFSDDFYRKELKGKLEPVLNFIINASKTVHTEITTLLIPGKNDSFEEISAAAGFIAEQNINIPYHLSAYYPSYKYSLPPTSPKTLIEAADTASEKLNFVFTGNIRGGRSDTRCPSCGALLISRDGYRTIIPGIENGLCRGCGTPVSEFGIIL